MAYNYLRNCTHVMFPDVHFCVFCGTELLTEIMEHFRYNHILDNSNRMGIIYYLIMIQRKGKYN